MLRTMAYTLELSHLIKNEFTSSSGPSLSSGLQSNFTSRVSVYNFRRAAATFVKHHYVGTFSITLRQSYGFMVESINRCDDH